MNENRMAKLRDLLRVQDLDGNWDASSYMRGLRNGLELALAVLEDREPAYKEAAAFKAIKEREATAP
jgi:hypothetical protein